jgi:hypothetical protein
VDVDHRRVDVGVLEQLLTFRDVSAGLHQVGCETVARGVDGAVRQGPNLGSRIAEGPLPTVRGVRRAEGPQVAPELVEGQQSLFSQGDCHGTRFRRQLQLRGTGIGRIRRIPVR